MKNIPKPTVDFSELYNVCVQGKQEPARSALLSIHELVVDNAQNYDVAARQQQLFTLAKLSPAAVSKSQKAELNKLYDDKLVRGPGRDIYDKILIAGIRCPLCGHGISRTLDHYLPKDVDLFPELSIHPANLIPACRDCNSLKSNDAPSSNDDQYIHPYFDDIESYIWLEAQTTYSSNGYLTVTYAVSNGVVDAGMRSRIHFQFDKLQLNRVYSIQSATEISGRQQQWQKTYQRAGILGIREEINNEMTSRALENKNSWQAALYRCLGLDNRFQSMDWCI